MITDDERAIQALREAMRTECRDHRLAPGTAAAVLDRVDHRRSAPRRRARESLAIVAACLVVIGAAAGLYAIRAVGGRSAPPATPSTGSACVGAVVTSALPTWARGGFTPGAYVNPHVTGASKEIVGVLFTDPLRVRPRPGTANKILWVAKDAGAGPLVIHAHLQGSDRKVTRTVPAGPGPSIIDMPAPGCWQLTLNWSGHTDTAALPYAP